MNKIDCLLINLPYKSCIGRVQKPYSYIDVLRVNHIAGKSFNSFAGEPVGLQLLEGYLNANGIDTILIDAFLLEYSLDDLINRIRNYKYDILCITLSSGGEEDLIYVLKNITYEYKPKVIIGGPGTVFLDKSIFKQIKQSFSIFNGKIEDNITEINRFFGLRNVKPYCLVQQSRSQADLCLKKGLSLSIITSKGCSWGRCSFCFENHKINPYHSARKEIDLRLIKAQLECVKNNYSVKHVTVTDIDFIGQGKRSVERALKIARVFNDFEITWMIDCRLDQFDKVLFEELKSTGLRSVFIGVESTVNRFIKIYNKYSTVKYNLSARDIFLELQNIGIYAIPGMIMFDYRKTYREILDDEKWLRGIEHFDISRRLTRLTTPQQKFIHKYQDEKIDALYDGLGYVYNLIFQIIYRKIKTEPNLTISDYDRNRIRNIYEIIIDELIKVIGTSRKLSDITHRRNLFSEYLKFENDWN